MTSNSIPLISPILKTPSRQIVAAVLGLAAATLAHGSVTVTFSADTDLGLFADTSPANWSVAGGVLTAASDANISSINGTYYVGAEPADTTFLLAGNGNQLILEVTYLWKGVNIQANNTDVIRLGIDTGTTDALPDYSGVLRGTASGNRNHRVGNYNGTNLVASAANTNITNTNVPLILETVFTRVDAATLLMSTTLWNATKTTPAISTLDRTVTVAAGYFDNPLYAGLFINGDASRTTTTGWTSEIQVDNFTMTFVPEPSTYALLGGLAALALVMARRRVSRLAA